MVVVSINSPFSMSPPGKISRPTRSGSLLQEKRKKEENNRSAKNPRDRLRIDFKD
jgi:hypothetical protein